MSTPFEEGIYYQFQIARDPADFKDEITCPDLSDAPPTVQCFGAWENGSDTFGTPPDDRDLPFSMLFGEDREVKLDVHGLAPDTEYSYRVVWVERVNGVDVVRWKAPPTFGPTKTIRTAEFAEICGYDVCVEPEP